MAAPGTGAVRLDAEACRRALAKYCLPKIDTVEMHTGGEPLRIVLGGYPTIGGQTILEKRRFARDELDHLRKRLMFEPRGHYDMYGALLVPPDLPDAHLAVLFIHNEGYSTMCGHGVIALARFAVDFGYVEATCPETEVNIQCPCGLVRARVECKGQEVRTTGQVRFLSVPAFLFAKGVKVDVPGHGCVEVDISYGGAFYALLSTSALNLDLATSGIRNLVEGARAVSKAVKGHVTLKHPLSGDLAFLYGTILTDGCDQWQATPTCNLCIFADSEVDRSPTGSGVTARIALQMAKGQIELGQSRRFSNSATGSEFSAKAVEHAQCGQFNAVLVEVSGTAHYTGMAAFTAEEEDPMKNGFLLK